MPRYIDADEAIKIINGLGSREYRREKGRICDAIKMLSSEQYIPTADVQEVVRCKDCKFRYTATCFAKHETAEEDFCSNGAKMDEEDQNESTDSE